MGCHRSRDLLRFFNFKKVPNNLSVMRCLPRQSLNGIAFLNYFSFAHDLNLLGRLRD